MKSKFQMPSLTRITLTIALPLSTLISIACQKQFLKEHTNDNRAATLAAALSARDKQKVSGTIDQASGRLTAAMSSSALVTQEVSPNGDSNLAGVLLKFPPGSLAIDTNISLQESVPIATSSAAASLGLRGSVTAVGLPLAVQPSILVDPAQPFIIALQLPPGAGLRLASGLDNLVVMYKANVYATKQVLSGILPRSALTIEGDSVRFPSRYFGAFQIAYTETLVEQAKEVETATPVQTKYEVAALPALSITSRSPYVVRAAETVTLTGKNFRPSMILSLGGQLVSHLKLISEESASFVVPSGVGVGGLNLTAEQDGVSQVISLIFTPSSGNIPVITMAPADVCSGQKYYDANGQLQVGIKSCPLPLPACAADGGIGCTANVNYPAVGTSGLASKIVSGQTVAGVIGTVAVEAHNLDTNCSAMPTRSVFYGRSLVRQKFSCDKIISTVGLTDMPNYLTVNASGNTLSFSGFAPSGTQATKNWVFYINQAFNKLFSVKTTLLDNTLLASSISPPVTFNPNNGFGTSNNLDYDIGHSITLDNSWDGSIDDVNLYTSSIDTDIPGLTLYDACNGATAPYVCNGNNSMSGLNVNNSLKLKWPWSAFDQGSYYLDITAQAKIEGGTTTLPTKTFSTTLPIQSSGNVSINTSYDTNPGNLFDGQNFRYGIAIGSQSTAIAPVVGLAYIATNSSSRPYFQRLLIDRTATPGGASSGVDQNSATLEINTANSQDFSLNVLSTGDWVALSSVQAGASNDVAFSRVTDSATSPSLSTSLSLTTYNGTSDRALEVTTSKSFSDAGTARMGLAFVRRNTSGSTTYNLLVAKINPTGSNSATILDDLNYGLSSTGGYSKFERSGITNQIDRLRMAWISESGTGYFYVAHREATDLKLLKVRSSYAAGYGNTIGTIGNGVFANASTSSNQQSLDLALGTSSGNTVAAIVFRDANGDCYFQRADSGLVASTALKLTNLACYNPSVHFNSTSSRFVVTYAELNAGNKYDIKTTEVTIGTSDTFSSPVIVVADLAVFPIRLVTDFYPAGHWMAIFYRLINDPTLKFHGYHVSGR